MKKIILVIISYFTLTLMANAFCNLETIRIGDNFSYLKPELAGQVMPTNELFEVKVNGKQICSGEDYSKVELLFYFYNKKLVRIISFDQFSKIDHLKSFNYFYSTPSIVDENLNKKGVHFYQWDLQGKEIYLTIQYDEEDFTSQIEIVSSDFTNIIQQTIPNDR